MRLRIFQALSVVSLLAAPLAAGCASEASAVDEGVVDASEDAITAASCLFGRTRQALEASSALTLGPTRTLTKATALTDSEKLEIAAGVDGLTTPAAVFGAAQKGEVVVRDVTEKSSGRVFAYYRYSAGGHPRGFVVAKGTASRLAAIGESSISACKVSARKTAPSCLFGLTRQELDAKAGFTFGRETTLKPTSSLSAIRQQQLLLGIGGVATAKDAILATDDDVVTVRTITEQKTGRAFTSYRTHRGDNPVGFLFASGSLDLVLVDSDESLYQCLVEGSCVPAETAKAYFAGPLDAGSVFYAASSEQDGERHQDPQGRSVRWLAKTAETYNSASYVGGINDLWAVRFDVSKVSCGVTVTGEH